MKSLDQHWSIPGVPTAVVPGSPSFLWGFLWQGRRERGQALGPAVVLGAESTWAPGALGVFAGQLWSVVQTWGQGLGTVRGFTVRVYFPGGALMMFRHSKLGGDISFRFCHLPCLERQDKGQWLHTDKGHSYIDY